MIYFCGTILRNAAFSKFSVTSYKPHNLWLLIWTFFLYKITIFLSFSTEPNLLSGTAHSVNKRGVKRRDLDIEELREILSPLLPFVRIEHILPMSSEVLSDAVSQSSRTSIISDFFVCWILQKSMQGYMDFCIFLYFRSVRKLKQKTTTTKRKQWCRDSFKFFLLSKTLNFVSILQDEERPD